MLHKHPCIKKWFNSITLYMKIVLQSLYSGYRYNHCIHECFYLQQFLGMLQILYYIMEHNIIMNLFRNTAPLSMYSKFCTKITLFRNATLSTLYSGTLYYKICIHICCTTITVFIIFVTPLKYQNNMITISWQLVILSKF